MQRILLGQIPGVRNWVLPRWFRELPHDEPLAIMCLTAHRSPIVAQALVKAGFSNVSNISGGLMAWEKAGLPVQKSASKESHFKQPEA
jgi:rhodanese-related sulfurtransferase